MLSFWISRLSFTLASCIKGNKTTLWVSSARSVSGLGQGTGSLSLTEVWELWGFWDLGHQEQFPTVFQEGKQKRERGREPWPKE